jgi:DNA-binding transcriptional ArsR family regulator
LTDATIQIEGITLAVYLYVVKRGRPVGPRDVMKSVKLSSPSVAYRHLQKLEDSGYLSKNEYGEYVILRKTKIRGYVWLGRRLMPKMWLYASVFLWILVVELAIFSVHFAIETYEFTVFFSLLTAITGLSFAVFMVEGVLQIRRMGKTATE